MFTKKVSITQAASQTTFTYSDPIDLHEKPFSGMPIFLKIDINQSATSGQLFLTYSIGDREEGVFANVVTGSGTSLLLSSGTSIGGQGANGSWYIPLSIVPHSGCTKWLTAVPYIKIGARADRAALDVSMSLCVG